MTESIIRQKGISLYRQVAMLLRSRLEEGQWQACDRLPSIEELAREFGVARVTIRQALQILEAEGMTVSRQGKGTFVQPHAQKGLSMQAGWQPLVNVVETRNHSVAVLASDMRSTCPTLEGYPCIFAPEYRFQSRIRKDDLLHAPGRRIAVQCGKSIGVEFPPYLRNLFDKRA